MLIEFLGCIESLSNGGVGAEVTIVEYVEVGEVDQCGDEGGDAKVGDTKLDAEKGGGKDVVDELDAVEGGDFKCVDSKKDTMVGEGDAEIDEYAE